MSRGFDVLVVGAGPAGTVAATVLARAGVRVRIVDRASFPREKLCGDTVNPGTLARLRRLQLADPIDRRGLAVDGMLVTGQDGTAVEGRYPRHLSGRAIVRADLDWALLQQAMEAGAEFEPAVTVRHASVTASGGGPRVDGVSTDRGALDAPVTIAADGRRSALAFGLGLLRHPRRPRRWAIGGYFENALAGPAASLGEMHIRRGRYIGVAPVPGGLTNVCLVLPAGGGVRSRADGPDLGDPSALLRREVDRDPQLRDRFARARLVKPPVVLGPLAVDVVRPAPDGLILAGDACGFVDPMTGDGLRFAVRGGELAAAAALAALQHGWSGVHSRLAIVRRQEFRSKWRFNRALRALVASDPAVRVAAACARLSPALVRAIVFRAGDCDLASASS